MNELYLSKDTRELYLSKALPKKLKIKSEEHVEKWTQAFHQCRRELKETIVVVYCFVEPNCQLSSRSKPNKFQGETSTCSSSVFPIAVFGTTAHHFFPVKLKVIFSQLPLHSTSTSNPLDTLVSFTPYILISLLIFLHLYFQPPFHPGPHNLLTRPMSPTFRVF